MATYYAAGPSSSAPADGRHRGVTSGAPASPCTASPWASSGEAGYDRDLEEGEPAEGQQDGSNGQSAGASAGRGARELSGDCRSFYESFRRRRNRDLRDQIREQADVGGILDLAVDRGALWDAIGVSTALHAAAWKCRQGAERPDFSGDGRWHVLRELVRKKLSGLEARNLANNAWSLASMGCCDWPLLGEIAAGIPRVSSGLKTQEVSNSAWAFATAKWSDESLFLCLADEMWAKVAEGVNQDLTNTLWAFATVASPHAPLFELLGRHAVSRVAEFKPQELANAVWALATAAIPDEALTLRASRRALETLPEFLTQNLANFVWAYAKLGYAEDVVIRGVQAEVLHKLEHFSAQDLSTTAWAFSTMPHRDDRFLRRCAHALQGRVRAQGVQPQHISNTMWAFATVAFRHQPCFSDLARAAAGDLAAFKAQELSNALWAAATAAFRDQAFTDAVAREAAERLHEFDAQGIGNTTWAAAMLGAAARELYLRVWDRLGDGACLLRCTEKTFSMLSCAFFRCGEESLGWRLFDRLALNRVNPGVAALGTWLHHCRHRHPDAAREARALLYLAKLRPCRHLMLAVLNAAVLRLGDLGEAPSACQLLRQMAADGASDRVTELLREKYAGAPDAAGEGALPGAKGALAMDWRVPPRIRGNPRCDYDKECQVLRYVTAVAERGNPLSVIESIERFSEEDNGWLKIAGDEKGAVLDDFVRVLSRAPPRLVLEFGCYVGYSACRMARLLRGGEGHLVSVEVDPVHACIARSVIEYAGLADLVSIYVGYSEEAIPNLRGVCRGQAADIVFMDQRGTRFHTDLHALEAEGLLAPHCLVTADNCLKPGAPHFLWYLSKSEQYQLTVVSLREFAADKIEDWMVVARYMPQDAAPGPPAEPPEELDELAFRTDRVRQRSCAGDNPGEVNEDAWAVHSQDVRRAYTAAGICPRVVEVLRREDGKPFVDWEGSWQQRE